MFAITGVTGQVGGVVVGTLLAANRPVRAVVRDPRKVAIWEERGCEVAVADINDSGAVAAAFQGAEGVFVLVPRTSIRRLIFPRHARRPPRCNRRSTQRVRVESCIYRPSAHRRSN